jgi:protease I
MTDKKLSGKRVLTFVGDIYEDLELWYPKLRLIEEGAQVVVAGEEANRVYSGKNGYPCMSDAAIGDMQESQFDAILLPGGFMPDRLRRLDSVKKLIRDFAHSKKCVAAICHGGWLAISAGVYRGVKTTESKTTWKTPAPFGSTPRSLSTGTLSQAANRTIFRGSLRPW